MSNTTRAFLWGKNRYRGPFITAPLLNWSYVFGWFEIPVDHVETLRRAMEMYPSRWEGHRLILSEAMPATPDAASTPSPD